MNKKVKTTLPKRMDKNTCQFFVSLKQILNNFDHLNMHSNMMDIFLLHHGLKPGILFGGDDDDNNQLDIKKLYELIRQEIIIHSVTREQEYYGDNIQIRSIWILTKRICEEVKLELKENEEPEHDLWWRLLGYASDINYNKNVSYVVSINLIPSFELLEIICDDNVQKYADYDYEIRCLTFGVKAQIFEKEEAKIKNRLDTICRFFANKKLGKSYFKIQKIEKSDIYE